MQRPSPLGDPGPLEKLCGDEQELERGLGEARREAAAAIAAARGEAERIASEARGALERELERVRADGDAAATREVEAASEEAARDVAALAARAERNRPRALARLVEIVLGRGPP